MASRSLGTLTLDLIAKVGGFVAGMDAAERRSEKWRKEVEKNAAKVSRNWRCYCGRYHRACRTHCLDSSQCQ